MPRITIQLSSEESQTQLLRALNGFLKDEAQRVGDARLTIWVERMADRVALEMQRAKDAVYLSF